MEQHNILDKLLNKQYLRRLSTWRKWRLAFEGGDLFIAAYLKRFSARETSDDFTARKAMTYSPSFAKMAIVDIRNAIFQRMTEVIREGSPSYVSAMLGEGTGVDLKGSSMTHFMGAAVLDELLAMGKVAIWVDAPTEVGGDPFLYLYKVEEICNWDDEENPTNILLKDLSVDYDGDTGLIVGAAEEYRHARVVDGKVEVTIYDKGGKKGAQSVLDFDRLPMVLLTISESLMQDICNYQIALLNLASSDMNYVLRANFPLYVEQYDIRADMLSKFTNSPPVGSSEEVVASTSAYPAYPAPDLQATSPNATPVGVSTGIRYPIGTDRPGFISPDTDPLTASMAKQEQLKREIRALVNLSLANVSPTRSSSESKQEDEKGLEAGLSYIGQELARAENIIAAIWDEYVAGEGSYKVTYPIDYSLKSDSERQKEADATLEVAKKLPSKTAQRELTKLALVKLLGGSATAATIAAINIEVSEAEILYVDPVTLYQDLEAQLVSNRTASQIRGYAEDEAGKATEDHTDKLARIAVAQSEAARISSDRAPGTPTMLTEKEKKQDGI